MAMTAKYIADNPTSQYTRVTNIGEKPTIKVTRLKPKATKSQFNPPTIVKTKAIMSKTVSFIIIINVLYYF